MKTLNYLILLSLLAFTACGPATEKTEKDSKNPYDLEIVNDYQTYLEIVERDSNKKFVDLEEYLPDAVLDIRYATDNNFTGEVIYTEAKAFARLPVAKSLQKVQSDLKEQGLTLKIFDAYRPYAATMRFYEVYPDTMYVAAPWHGSRHNRGCAVDVSLVDRETGEEIPMPTPFDAFTEAAHPTYDDLAEEVIQNRQILIDVMNQHGFTVYPYEWWHYDYQGWEDYKLMDVSFGELTEN
ncbi:MAG: M15 family metallopeptidase [Bacteroidales bacterium]|nr:M15 family metallopeptidase [Bacteroidales bacterium]MCF8343045.1 M15 family metallopeptidase [Bacteroidales bacterium]MCF8349788.1 M15 family metallopeptidase [Bacteroidales bacterium]MCF8375908.1 M15 family metallopeptidase [Bacteroidales bacterium]